MQNKEICFIKVSPLFNGDDWATSVLIFNHIIKYE